MRTLFLIIACSSAVCIAGEELQVKRPLLWTIDVDDEDNKLTSAYLFGTIHVPDRALTTLHPQSQQAWDASTAAYFEIDFLKDTPAQTKAICLPPGQRIEDLVPPELVARLDARLAKISPVMTRQVLPKARVAVWPLLLGNLEAQAGHLGRLPMDMNMYRQAREAGRKVGGLEKAGQQIVTIRELPMSAQIEFLSATLDAMDDDDRNGISRLQQTRELYAAGDEKKFGDFLDAEFARTKLRPELLDRIRSSLLFERNVRMATEIVRLMKERPEERFFFAVGIGHLVGSKTVQDELTRLGCVIRRHTAADASAAVRR